MEISDLTKEKIESLKKTFYQNPKVKELQIKADRLSAIGDYAGALKLRKVIMDLFERCEQNYVNVFNKADEEIKLIETNIPPKDMREITKRILSLFMCCDIIETLIMDINDILHRYDKNFSFNQFEELETLAKSSKDKLEFLSKSTEYMDTMKWADVNDDMCQMMVNKANGLLNRYNNGK
jgi:hypothetical protein